MYFLSLKKKTSIREGLEKIRIEARLFWIYFVGLNLESCKPFAKITFFCDTGV
jgi:hypothetical protein